MDEDAAVELMIQHVKDYANSLCQEIREGSLTTLMASLLLQKYGRGVLDSIITIYDNPKVTTPILTALDEELEKLDPMW